LCWLEDWGENPGRVFISIRGIKMPEYENIKIEIEDGVALLTINRSKALNSLDLRTLDELGSGMDTLSINEEVKVIIITGEGEKAFIAGADIKEMANMDPIEAEAFSRIGQSVFNQLEKSTKPVIAAVNGFSLGGGCELALACHVRIASENAKFGQPEVKLGLIPGFGGTQRLPRLVGRGPAFEIILSGEMISANKALEIGLVNRVVPADELISACRELARQISENAHYPIVWKLFDPVWICRFQKH
jgi:enoyl-CoA hydratase